MQKNFLANISFLILANLLVKPLYIFGIELVVQNKVGESEYGFYFALFNLALVGQIFLDFGINNFNSRAIAQQPQLLPNYVGVIIPFKIVLSISYLMLCYAFAAFIGYPAEQWYWLFFIALIQIIASFSLYIRSNLQGLHHFRQDSYLSIADRICLLLLAGTWLAYTNNINIRQFIYLQTIAYTLAAFWGVYYLYRSLPNGITWHFDRVLVQKIARQTYPFALLSLFIAGNSRLESVWLTYWLPTSVGAYEAGMYAQSYRLLDAANMIAVLFATVLMPTFSRLLHQGESINRLTGFSGRLLFVGASTLSICSCFFAQPILQTLYPHSTSDSVTIFYYLSLSFIATSSCYVYGTLLTAKGMIRALNGIAGGILLFNLLADYLLINHNGAIGAAQAACLTQVIAALAYLTLSLKTCHLSTSWQQTFRLVAFVIGTIIIAYLCLLLPYFWAVSWLVAIFFSLLWSVLLGLWNWHTIINILKSEQS